MHTTFARSNTRFPRFKIATSEATEIEDRRCTPRKFQVSSFQCQNSVPPHRSSEPVISRFGSACLDGLEDFQKEFDAGGFMDGGEAFQAELLQAEQSADRNGLPLVNFSLSSGTYDPHAKIRPSEFEESVNISQFLKAGSYPMGVLGDASNVEPPPRFGMSVAQTSWQTASGRFPEEDFDNTRATAPRSRDTFSVSHGSGYSQIHGSGAGGLARVGTYTVLTEVEEGSAAPAAVAGEGGTGAGACEREEEGGKKPEERVEEMRLVKEDGVGERSGEQVRIARKASGDQRYSKGAGKTASAEETRASHHTSKTAPSERSHASRADSHLPDHSRPSQDSQDASITLINTTRPSQDSQDSSREQTLTPARPQSSATPAGARPRPEPRLSAALGDSLRRKIVDVLNRTEEARLQLMTPGRQAGVDGQQRTVSQMVAVSEQPTDVWETSAPPVPETAEGIGTRWVDASVALSDDTAWRDGDQRPQPFSDDLNQRQQREVADQRRRQEERVRAARAQQGGSDELQEREVADQRRRQEERVRAARVQQAALRQQWEAEQEVKERAERQRKLKKKREARARRDSAAAAERAEDASKLTVNDDSLSPTLDSAPSVQPTTAPHPNPDNPCPPPNDPPPPPPPPSTTASSTTVDRDAVSRILQDLNAATAAAATPALTMQQVVEAVMKQLNVPDVSLDESCRSRAELNVTDILQELKGEGRELCDLVARSSRRAGASEGSAAVSSAGGGSGGAKAPGKDVSRMAETVSRLHRGVPARPRGEHPRRRSPVQRSASIPVQPASPRRKEAARPTAAATAARRRPVSACLSDDSARRRPNSAHSELAVRGRRVPRMGTRRPVEDLTTDESDRGVARGKRGSPGKTGRKPVSRASGSGAAAAKPAPVSTCPDTASSDGSGRTYSITSDRAPGSLPAVVTKPESEPNQPASTATAAAPAPPDFARASTDYESPEFLVALAARRYPSSTPSLARSVAAFVASESLDHVSPIAPADSDASEPGAAAHAEPAGRQEADSGAETGVELCAEPCSDVGTVDGAEEAVAVLVPPPAVWPSEGESSVDLPVAGRSRAAVTSTGSMATTAVSAARQSSGAASLQIQQRQQQQEHHQPQLQYQQQAHQQQQQQEDQQPQLHQKLYQEQTQQQYQQQTQQQQHRQQQQQRQQQPQQDQQQQPAAVTASTSAETTSSTARPRRSRIPTPVRRHVSDLPACQSAPCLLQTDPPPPPAALPSAVPAAAAGRRPGQGLSGGERRPGPRPVVRANSATGAGKCDAAAQTGVSGAAAGVTQSRGKLVRSGSAAESGKRVAVSAQIQQSRGQRGQTAGKAVSHAAARVQTDVPTAAEEAKVAPPVDDKPHTERAAAWRRTSSVSTAVQTCDLTFTKPAPSEEKPSQLSQTVAGAGSPSEQPDMEQAPTVVSGGVQTEADQSWTEPTARSRDRLTEGSEPQLSGDSAPAPPTSGRTPLSNIENIPSIETAQKPAPQTDRPGQTGRAVKTVQTVSPAASGDISLTPTPTDTTTNEESLVDTPSHITHPDVLCTDIPTDLPIPVTNRTDHWVQLIPTITSLELNGAAVPADDSSNIATVSLRSRTLLDRHQTSSVHASVTPRTPGRITVTLTLTIETIDRRLSGAGGRSCAVQLRLVAERPAVEVLSQEPGVFDFGTLPEDCRRVVPLTLVNLSRAAVPVTLSVLSAGRAFHLPDGDPAEPGPGAPTRLTSTLAQFTLPAADAGRQGISPVTVNVALLTPCLQSEKECPPVEPLYGRLEVQLAGSCPPPPEPLLSCRLLATVGRVKLRTRSREPLELRCRPAETTSVNLPMKNAGNIPLELRLSVTGLRDSVWVRPDHVTIPPRGERDVMLTFQPRDRDAGGRGLLVLGVQPEGVAYEVDIVGVIGECRSTTERQRPGSPEMKSARRHRRASKPRSPGRTESRSPSRSTSPGAPPAGGVAGDAAAGAAARDTAVQTSLLALAPAAGDAPAPAPAQPVFRQPAELPQPPRSQRSTGAPALHSNRRQLLWTAVRCGRPAACSLTLRNSSETEPLALRVSIVSGPQFSLRMFDDDPSATISGGSSAELRLPPRSERELTVVYQPSVVEAVAATLVMKPVMRPRGGVASKFTIPLIAYSGAAEVHPSLSPETGLQLGEVQPGAAVHAPLTVTNSGDRRAFVYVLAYKDAECRHPLTSAEFTARPARLSLAAGESRQVALVLRLRPGSSPPAALRLLTGEELLRQAFSRLPRDRPLSSRLASPGLIAVDFSAPFEGEREPDPAEQAALSRLANVADTFFAGLRQTRLPIRATISCRPMDSSDVFTLLHADDTVASILNNTSVANVTREVRRAPPPAAAAPQPAPPVAAAVTRSGPAQWSGPSGPPAAPAHDQLDTSQLPVRLPPPASDLSAVSGPVCAAPAPAPGRPAALRLASDQVTFPTTAVGRRSAAALAFTNAGAVALRWTLEALVKPWIQSTPRACDLTPVGGEVFRFHPTQGEARPGETVSLAARFNPPAAGYFSQTFYLVTCADATLGVSDQSVQPACLLVRVAGQATPAAADPVTEPPERFPLTVEPDTIEFPPDQRAVKLTINNKTRTDYEFELRVSGPFSVNHERMLSRARRYIHLPVFFQPPGAGLCTGRLTLSLAGAGAAGQARAFHVTLMAEVP